MTYRRAAPAAALLLALTAPGFAQSQPPIRDAQDQTCRDEARSRVIGEVPRGGDMRVAGERFYHECMRRLAAKATPSRQAGSTATAVQAAPSGKARTAVRGRSAERVKPASKARSAKAKRATRTKAVSRRGQTEARR